MNGMTANALLFSDTLAGDLLTEEVDVFLPRVWGEFVYQYGTSVAGASSTTTPGAIGFEPGTVTYVTISTFRGSSADPDVVTLSGGGQTWEEVTLPNGYWSSGGTTRRRVQLFKAEGVAGNGQLTVSYTNTPSRIQLFVDRYYNSSGSPVQVVDEIQSMTNFVEYDVAMSAKQQTSAVMSFIVTNVADNEDQLEMSGVNWRKLRSLKVSSAPTASHSHYKYPSDGISDLSPGWISSKGGSAAAYQFAIEIPYGVYSSPNVPLYGFGGQLRVLTGTLKVMTTGGLVQVYP